MNDALTRTPHESHRVAVLLRRAGVVEVAPPDHVWESVVARLGEDPAARAGMPQRATARTRHRGRGSGRRRLPAVLVAAAAGALVTWAGLALTSGEDPAGDSGQILAQGALAPLTAEQPAGTATVVEIDGRQRLRVELDEAPAAGEGYLEVWLLRPDVSGLVTLGVLDGASGDYLVPAGLDLADYPVVDISLEQLDGDPGHGGQSLVRGEIG